MGELREEYGTSDKPFSIFVISMDAFSVDGIKRLENEGVTDVIVVFRWPYEVGPDIEALSDKIDKLRWFADGVMAKTNE